MCVLSLPQASVASSQTTIFGTSGTFLWAFYGGGRGPTAEDRGGLKKVCKCCGTVGNSDPLPHSAGTGGLHVGNQPNRRRGRAAKPII